MADKTKEKKELSKEEKPAPAAPAEKIYTIPLRKAFRKARKKRTPYAARLVRSFLLCHTKADDVKLGSVLNSTLWERGITKPPRRVRVGVNIKIIENKKVAQAELLGYAYKEFRAEKGKSPAAGLREKMLSRLGPKAVEKQALEESLEGKEEKTEEKEKEKK